MLKKGAVGIVIDPGSGSAVYFSRGKVDWRMEVRDRFFPLNGFIHLTPFKMETVASVLSSIRESDSLLR